MTSGKVKGGKVTERDLYYMIFRNLTSSKRKYTLCCAKRDGNA